MSINLEEHNLKQIKRLNQRGGRMLSIIDLLEAKTVSSELAGFLLYTMSLNLSFLTAANPSGTGKTTLMGTMLNLLKPGIKIKTLTGSETAIKPDPETRYLVHEIGSGPYFSYLWGKKVTEFFKLAEKATIASCLHADALPEMKQILSKSPLNISDKALANVNLILFMTKEGGIFNARRRVVDVYGYIPSQDQYILLYQLHQETDTINAVNVSAYRKWLARVKGVSQQQVTEEIKKCSHFLEKLKEQGVKQQSQVRAAVVDFYKNNLY